MPKYFRFTNFRFFALTALLAFLPFVSGCGRSELEGPAYALDAGGDAARDAQSDAPIIPSGTLLGLDASPSPVVIAVGETLQLVLTARFDTGAELDIADRATWVSGDPLVASAAAGKVSGLAPGRLIVDATWGGITVRIPVEIRAEKAIRLDVSPAVVSIGVRTAASLQALAVFANGAVTDVSSSAIWSSEFSAIATVDPTGQILGVAAGATAVRATFDGLTGTASVKVTGASVTALRVDPAVLSLATGALGSFTATAFYADGTQADATGQSVWSTTTAGVAVATVPGSFSATAPGTTDIVATFTGVTGKAMLTVIAPATVASVVVTPFAASLTIGATRVFTATATLTDGSTTDVTASAVWTTDAATVVTVSSGGTGAGTAQAIGAGQAVVTATFGGKSGTANITIPAIPATLTKLTITPSPVTLAFGASAQLSVIGTYSNASTQDLTASAVWVSSAFSTAAVSQGLVSGIASGTANVTATVGAVSATVLVTVTAAPLRALVITPAAITLDVGATTNARALGTFADGSSSDVTEQCAWLGAAPAIAGVSATSGTRGLVNGAAAGTTTITASLQGIQATASVTVRTPVTYVLQILPSTASIRVGSTQAFTATRAGSDGSSFDVTATATWVSSSLTVASMAAAVATGVSDGTTTISATAGGLTGSATLVVTPAAPTPTELRVSPPTTTIAVGATSNLVATLVFSDGSAQDVTSSATWVSAASATASVSAGTVVGQSPGTVLVTATASGFSASASVTVSAIPAGLLRLELSPANGTLSVGASQTIVVTAVFSDGTRQDVSALATATSNAPNVAAVTAGPTVRGVAPGSATISVSYTGLTASGTWTVTSPTPTITSITVTLTPSTIGIGATATATATARYSNGATQNITRLATWTSSATAVATVTAGTTVTARGVATGTASITATFNGVAGSATLTVSPLTLTNLLILPVSATMGVGDTRAFTAQAVYSNNTTVDVTTQATWASSNAGVATASDAAGSKGLVTAIAAGTATISATFGGRTATATVSIARMTGIVIRITNLAPIPFIPTLTVGLSTQFYAMASFSNGTTQDVTMLATWSSSNPSILFVNDSGTVKGEVTAISRGTATVRAAYVGFTAQQNVTVR